jgi:hypothetical protein
VRTVTVSQQQFELDRRKVERAVRHALPDPIREHFVVIGELRWPPKQVLSLVTGLDRADFTTHQARRTLMRLGFAAGRKGRGPVRPEPARRSDGGAETLRPHIGRWVAVRDDEVLVAAESPAQVVAWLAEHDQRATSMFRVPESEDVAGGIAPS